MPAGIASVRATIPVPSNVRLVGAGKNASIIQKTFNGPLFDFSGSDTTRRCQRGGLADLQLNGGGHSGPLVQASYADHLNFDRTWFNQNGDCALVGTELWDTYFQGCEFEWCGTSAWRTGSVVRLLSSPTDSTNEAYFSQCRWESFPGHALYADSNSSHHAPYGIWLSQCKMESAQISGPAFIETTNDASDVHLRDLYLAADGGSYRASSLINLVAAANFTIDGIHAWVNGAAQSVIRLYPGPVGHAIHNVYVDAPAGLPNGIVDFAGGNPIMRVGNVRAKAGQPVSPYHGTIPAGVVLEDL